MDSNLLIQGFLIKTSIEIIVNLHAVVRNNAEIPRTLCPGFPNSNTLQNYSKTSQPGH